MHGSSASLLPSIEQDEAFIERSSRGNVQNLRIQQPITRKQSYDSLKERQDVITGSPARTLHFGKIAAQYSIADYADMDIRVQPDARRAKWADMRIFIVGAGIAGLSAAISLHSHGFTDITILEKSSHAVEAGAGIQVAPNMSRLLRKWGCLESLRPAATPLSEIQIRRWENNAILGSTPLMPEVEAIHGAPLWVVHRKDLSEMLRNIVLSCGTTIQYNSAVADIDLDRSRLKLQTGKWIDADVILAGDGVKSDLRSMLSLKNNEISKAIDTGDAAYRLLIPKNVLEPYPEYLALLDSNSAIRWIGPNSHIMLYPICKNSVLNVVLICPDTNDSSRESWSAQGDRDIMIAVFSSWNPFVVNLISLAPGLIFKWKLRTHPLMKTWISDKMALIGDAAHPMLPYVAQGASQSMEDGAAIGACLAGVKSLTEVNSALQKYETLRKDRAEKIQLSAMKTREALHLPDGNAQRERDKIFARISSGGRNVDLWGDPEWQKFMWAEDVTYANILE